MAMPGVMAAVAVLAALAGPAGAGGVFRPGETQYIAALGDPAATAGNDAESWGLWSVDPGPRGVWARDLAGVIAAGGVAPAGWRFDQAAWWMEEHGLVMEKPVFALPPGQYVVTGGREVTSVLTVAAPDAQGHQAWRLADGASIHDVTHLRCRAAVYTPVAAGRSCAPEAAPLQKFPLGPGEAMPAVEGCARQAYQVLIVIGRIVEG